MANETHIAIHVYVYDTIHIMNLYCVQVQACTATAEPGVALYTATGLHGSYRATIRGATVNALQG